MHLLYLDDNPYIAAYSQTDEDILSSITSCVQVLSIWAKNYKPLYIEGEEVPVCLDEEIPWVNIASINLQCVEWANEGLGNVDWITKHLNGLLLEYDYRFENKDGFKRAREISNKLIPWLNRFPFKNNSCPRGVFPDVYKSETTNRDSIKNGYRKFYTAEKLPGASFTKCQAPAWKAEPKVVKELIAIVVTPQKSTTAVFDTKVKTIDPRGIKI